MGEINDIVTDSSAVIAEMAETLVALCRHIEAGGGEVPDIRNLRGFWEMAKQADAEAEKRIIVPK